MYQASSSNDIDVSIAKETSVSRPSDETYDTNTIAIVGMPRRFRGGNTLNDLWNVIEIRRDVHTKAMRRDITVLGTKLMLYL